MFKGYLQSFAQTPQRLWAYSQHRPYEAIGYGAILLFLSLAAQPLITIAAGVAVLGGIYQLFGSKTRT